MRESTALLEAMLLMVDFHQLLLDFAGKSSSSGGGGAAAVGGGTDAGTAVKEDTLGAKLPPSISQQTTQQQQPFWLATLLSWVGALRVYFPGAFMSWGDTGQSRVAATLGLRPCTTAAQPLPRKAAAGGGAGGGGGLEVVKEPSQEDSSRSGVGVGVGGGGITRQSEVSRKSGGGGGEVGRVLSKEHRGPLRELWVEIALSHRSRVLFAARTAARLQPQPQP